MAPSGGSKMRGEIWLPAGATKAMRRSAFAYELGEFMIRDLGSIITPDQGRLRAPIISP
jgi:hypothetical protein